MLGQYLPSWFAVPRRGRTYVYVRRPGGGDAPVWLQLLLFSLLGGLGCLLVARIERSLHEKTLFYPIIEKNVVELGSEAVDPGMAGNMVHLNARTVAASDPPVDPLFRVGGFDQSIRLRRRVEFCEWREFSTESCRKTGSGDNEREVCTRQYYYIKDWQSSHVTSMMFDQPFGHQNPSRPELMQLLRDGGGDAHTGGAIFEAPHVYAAHTSNSDLVELDKRIVSAFDWFRNLVKPTPSMLEEFRSSPASSAALPPGEQPSESKPVFRYVGGGYFVSFYAPGTGWKILRGLGMAFDGSLLDYQIADLFSKCEAGDVRVSFDVVEASPVSVVGKLGFAEGNAGTSTPHLTAINPSWLLASHGKRSAAHSGDPIVIVRQGRYGASQLISADLRFTRIWSYGLRLAFAAVCVFSARATSKGGPWIPHIVAAAAFSVAVFWILGAVHSVAGTGSAGQWSAWMLLMGSLALWMWRIAPRFAEWLWASYPSSWDAPADVQMEPMGFTDGKKAD
ncbi:hypothetical protein DFJ74DRAFT_478980 [Hyaloraphidium curvatum]|nr:hypothetical protein DFJ74DRAFT_478980 [Hyaloraphidium curvatum]